MNMNNLDDLRKHFEANMLDGDPIQAGQMLSSESVFEYITYLLKADRAASFEQGRIAEAKTCEDTRRHDTRALLEQVKGEMPKKGGIPEDLYKEIENKSLGYQLVDCWDSALDEVTAILDKYIPANKGKNNGNKTQKTEVPFVRQSFHKV